MSDCQWYDCHGVCEGLVVWNDCAETRCGEAVVDCAGVCGGTDFWTDCDGTQCGSNYWTDCEGSRCGSVYWTDCDGIQCGPNNYNDDCGTPCGNCRAQEFGWRGACNCIGEGFYINYQLTTLPVSGTGWWSDKFWIGGTETTLPESGTGWWSDKYWVAGTETSLPEDGTGIWDDKQYFAGILAVGWIAPTYWINGVATSLPQSGTGVWNDKQYFSGIIAQGWFAPTYYIGGIATTLPQSGTGGWNGRYYFSGVETTLNESGTGWWNNKYYINLAETTLPQSGTGWWNNKYYVGGQLLTGLTYINKSEPFPNEVGHFYFINGLPSTGDYQGKSYFGGRYAKNVVPRNNGFGKIGTETLKWREGHFSSYVEISNPVQLTDVVSMGMDSETGPYLSVANGSATVRIPVPKKGGNGEYLSASWHEIDINFGGIIKKAMVLMTTPY